MTEIRLSPASAEDALRDAPEHVQEKYRDSGITLYRAIVDIPHSDIKMVEEGYIEDSILPNGKKLSKRIALRLMHIEDAQERE